MKKALALIIGNAEYPGDNLVNPVNDAEDLTTKLKSFGYVVRKGINVDLDQFNSLVEAFGNDLNNYDVGLFYFAGHGLQIDGENFLTATNTKFDNETTTKYSSVILYKVLDYMHKAKNDTNILILDACRNNPFEKRWTRSGKESGLAPMYAPKGTIIAYATSPGEVASNGKGRNGLYTSCILHHLDEEHLTIEELFKRVRNSVFAFSGGKQTSWEHTSLTGKFIFNSGSYLLAPTSDYSATALADRNYEPSDNPIDNLIESLKSHNWYIQNPAIDKIATLEGDLDKNRLFVLGRNILQASAGGSRNAHLFIRSLSRNIERFNVEEENHLLNGILFEIYFGSDGKFRSANLKSQQLNEIFSLSREATFFKAFEFIHAQTIAFSDDLFFVPKPNPDILNIDIVLEKAEGAKREEYLVKQIKLEGKDLLVRSEDLIKSPFYSDDELIYEPYKYSKFKTRLVSELGIPMDFVRLNTNLEVDDDTNVLYPFGFKLKK